MDFTPILPIDQWLLTFFNGSDSLFIDQVAVTLTDGLTWVPLYVAVLFLVVKNNDTMAQIMLTIVCALVCVVISSTVADGIVKPLVGRPRPLNDPVYKDTIDTVAGMFSRQYSFFSGHASNTFSLALFLALLIRSRLATCLLVGWSLLNCWTRLYLGMHYPSDILAGLLWGAFVGTVMYHLYRYLYYRFSPRISYVSSQYTRTGYAYSDVDVMCAVFVFTLLYAVMKALVH